MYKHVHTLLLVAVLYNTLTKMNLSSIIENSGGKIFRRTTSPCICYWGSNMLQPKSYSVVFSFTQPEAMLNTLLPILRQLQEHPDFKSSRLARRTSQTVLLIDEQAKRAQFIINLLHVCGYEVHTVVNTLDAFTYCLRENLVPLAILLNVEQVTDRFFLTRLLQQVTQKYAWNPVCIYVQTYIEASSQPRQLPPPRSLPAPRQPTQPHTDPLPQLSPIPAPEPALPNAQQETLVHALPALPTPPTLPVSVPVQFMRAIVPAALLPSRIRPENAAVQMPGSSSSYKASGSPTAPLVAVSGTSPETLPTKLTRTHSRANEVASKTPTQGKKASLLDLSIGRYHIQASLGNGPSGEVYRTYDRLREHNVALKAVQLDTIPSYMNPQDVTNDVNPFQQEIDLLNTISHPHILMPSGVGKSYISGSPFVYKTMRYCAAGSLAAWLYTMGNAKTLAVEEVVQVVMQVADALQKAHSRNITFQNFKLSNLLIRDEVSKDRKFTILLSDFSLMQNGRFLLKIPTIYPYMAPECWQGQTIPASDQYGLASIAYELLTGRPLFSGQSEHIIRQLHQTMQPQPPSTLSAKVSPAVDAVILRALAKRPEERFPSIMAFADALQKRSNV